MKWRQPFGRKSTGEANGARWSVSKRLPGTCLIGFGRATPFLILFVFF